MLGSSVYKPLLLVSLVACGRIDYEPQSPAAVTDGGTGGGGQVDYACPGYTFNISGGNQDLESDCDDSFAFRIQANQAATVRVEVSSSLFVPALTLTEDLCAPDQERSLSETGTSASVTTTMEAGETVIGVISPRSGECQRFMLSVEVL